MTTEVNQENLKIVYKNRSLLSCYVSNARTHSNEQVEQIVRSIQEFGWTNPILIDENDEVIAGHGRLLAAERLGFNEVPTITLEGLSEQQEKAYRLADNKLPLNAGWDDELLKIELSDLLDSGFDIDLTGFSELDLAELFTESETGISEESPYTGRIESPVYEPSGDKPETSELYDASKTQELIKRIRDAKLPADIEQFLISAAERHTVFNFARIADYYAHSPENIQGLFEESALVIIDFNQAIENGLVYMTQQIVNAAYQTEVGDA